MAFKNGHIPWNKGKTWNKENRNKISKTLKRKYKTGEIIHGMLNRKHTKKTKIKMKNAKLKNPVRYWKDKKRIDMRGNKHPRWNPLTKTNYIDAFKIKEWRNTVFKRDKYICQECGKRNCYLHPHHIVPKIECHLMDYDELIYDIDNGLTLCKECHMETGLHKNIHRGGYDFNL